MSKDLLGSTDPAQQPSNSGGLLFDFGPSDDNSGANAQGLDQKQQSLLDVARAPQGEFDFDFGAPASVSTPAPTFNQHSSSENTVGGGDIDLLNQPAQKSMDDLMNQKSDTEIKKEQEKTDKIQDFLNK